MTLSATAVSPPRNGSRIALTIVGAVVALLAVVALVGGGALVVMNETQRDTDGFYASGAKTLATPTNALTSDNLDFGTDTPDWLFRKGRLGTIRVTATGTPGKPIFVGVARESQVDAYLRGVAHDEITDFEFRPFSVTSTRRPGTGTPAAPTTESFWAATASGTGRQTATWTRTRRQLGRCRHERRRRTRCRNRRQPRRQGRFPALARIRPTRGRRNSRRRCRCPDLPRRPHRPRKRWRDIVSDSALSQPSVAGDRQSGLVARIAAAAWNETVFARVAIGVVALHVLDDNFLQPNPGTSAADHLLSGLVPLAILVVLAWLYPRLRAGARAAVAMTVGLSGITFGVPGAYYLQHGAASGDHYSGLLTIVASAALLLSAPVILWKSRRSGGSRRRRYLRRMLPAVAAPLLIFFIVFPVGYSYIYTHTGRTATTPDLRVPYERVTVTTSDSLELAGSYVPSKNRAAVILFPGATRSNEARMLIRHGYGVLLLDPRGQGRSEGDTVRWAGDRDLLGAVDFLRSRADVDPHRIGGFGFSVGGEILLEAAAQSNGLKAVVSEGAGIRLGEALEKKDGVSAPNGCSGGR